MSDEVNYLILLGALFLSWANAAPLSEDSLRNAKNVVILTGEFDPWTEADKAYAEALLEKGEADLVITVPSKKVKGNIPLSEENRLLLMSDALSDHPRILYPQSSDLSPGAIAEKVQRISGARVNVRTSPPPAQNIRGFLQQNTDQYFSRTPGVAPEGIDPKVYNRILEKGFYLGQRPSSQTLVQRAQDWVIKIASDTGIFYKVKPIAVSLMAKTNVREIEMDGKMVPVERHIGAGAYGDAYITEIDGKKVVIKVARGGQAALNAAQDSIYNHQWLTKTSFIQVPELLGFDPSGRWISMGFVEGTQLDKYLAENMGNIPPKLDQELRKFYDEASRIQRQNGHVLDINTQNIFVKKDGSLVLVDFGPLSPSKHIAPTYEDIRRLWVDDAHRLIRKEPAKFRAACFRRGFESLGLGNH